MTNYLIQINGKLRSKISVADDANKEAIIEQAIADSNAQRYIGTKEIKKTVFIPGRLVNIVVANDLDKVVYPPKKKNLENAWHDMHIGKTIKGRDNEF